MTTKDWLKDLQAETNLKNEHDVYILMVRTLQILRDRVTLEEAVDLGAQLPLIIRGAYYDGWKPDTEPLKFKKVEEFYELLQSSLTISEDIESEKAAKAVFKVLANRISAGELKDMKTMLPDVFEELFPE